MVINVYTTSSNSDKSSRHELLAFVNSCLQANLTGIEELSTGTAYCQLTDLLFRGSILLKKVKWNTRTDVDCLHNWRLLQVAWRELGISKDIPVERLVCGKFQDNFEFLQWFKMFFDANYDGTPYDPLNARNREMLPPGGSEKSRIALRNVKSQKSPTQQRKKDAPSKGIVKKTGGTTEEITVDYNDVIDFQIKMLQDRCRHLELNLNDTKKQRDNYADIIQAVTKLCENKEEPFSQEAVLSILQKSNVIPTPKPEANEQSSK